MARPYLAAPAARRPSLRPSTLTSSIEVTTRSAPAAIRSVVIVVASDAERRHPTRLGRRDAGDGVLDDEAIRWRRRRAPPPRSRKISGSGLPCAKSRPEMSASTTSRGQPGARSRTRAPPRRERVEPDPLAAPARRSLTTMPTPSGSRPVGAPAPAQRIRVRRELAGVDQVDHHLLLPLGIGLCAAARRLGTSNHSSAARAPLMRGLPATTSLVHLRRESLRRVARPGADARSSASPSALAACRARRARAECRRVRRPRRRLRREKPPLGHHATRRPARAGRAGARTWHARLAQAPGRRPRRRPGCGGLQTLAPAP